MPTLDDRIYVFFSVLRKFSIRIFFSYKSNRKQWNVPLAYTSDLPCCTYITN